MQKRWKIYNTYLSLLFNIFRFLILLYSDLFLVINFGEFYYCMVGFNECLPLSKVYSNVTLTRMSFSASSFELVADFSGSFTSSLHYCPSCTVNLLGEIGFVYPLYTWGRFTNRVSDIYRPILRTTLIFYDYSCVSPGLVLNPFFYHPHTNWKIT